MKTFILCSIVALAFVVTGCDLPKFAGSTTETEEGTVHTVTITVPKAKPQPRDMRTAPALEDVVGTEVVIATAMDGNNVTSVTTRDGAGAFKSYTMRAWSERIDTYLRNTAAAQAQAAIQAAQDFAAQQAQQ